VAGRGGETDTAVARRFATDGPAGACLDKFEAELRKGWATRFGKVCALMKTAKR
jgi:hypothetical protein